MPVCEGISAACLICGDRTGKCPHKQHCDCQEIAKKLAEAVRFYLRHRACPADCVCVVCTLDKPMKEALAEYEGTEAEK